MYNFCDKIDKTTALNISPIVLAFVGDAVYSLIVRGNLAVTNNSKSGELNKIATSIVRASAQADLSIKLLPLLTEDELMVFKRARNTKKTTKAKSASVVQYNASTGFEAVFGYLYLTNDIDRINYLIKKVNEDED